MKYLKTFDELEWIELVSKAFKKAMNENIVTGKSAESIIVKFKITPNGTEFIDL